MTNPLRRAGPNGATAAAELVLADNEPNRLLEAALAYAARGWAVLPLHTPTGGGCSCRDRKCRSIGKHPRTLHGVKDATTDAAQIRTWWADCGQLPISG